MCADVTKTCAVNAFLGSQTFTVSWMQPMISFNCNCVEKQGMQERIYSFVKVQKQVTGSEPTTEPVEVTVTDVPFTNITVNSQAYYSKFIWPAAVVLSSFTVYRPELFVNKRVLELGAGKALCSLTAKAVGARSVVATDFDSNDDDVNENRVPVRQLRWGEFNKQTIDLLCFNNDDNLDIILGSDLFYEEMQETDTIVEEKIDRVLSMVVLAKQRNPDLMFICSAVIRTFDQYQRFLQSLCNWKLEVLHKYTPQQFIQNYTSEHNDIEILLIR
mmetsp:Transcript_7015/g.8856  ORF Transcript_7015/g.8856 Transcript_7015/m.8856 type:complete len:273 (-) Transcript_7015:84-902(-)